MVVPTSKVVTESIGIINYCIFISYCLSDRYQTERSGERSQRIDQRVGRTSQRWVRQKIAITVFLIKTVLYIIVNIANNIHHCSQHLVKSLTNIGETS